MKWLVTGGCGFIGLALIESLRSEGGHHVRIVDNLSRGTRASLRDVGPFLEREGETLAPMTMNGGIELVVGDIENADLASKAVRGADVIVHLAANTGVGPSMDDPRADFMANALGVFNYLEAARVQGVSRFVFASSGAPLGEVEPPIHEELPAHPVSPYGASKLCGEAYVSVYGRTFGIDAVALRFGNVYGVGSSHKASVVARFITRALRGEVLEIHGDGSQTRDFINVFDIAAAILLAATREGIAGETFQIATNCETTVGELADLLVRVLAENGVTDVQLRHTAPRWGDVQRNFSDTSKAREKLGWSCRYELEEGLRETVAWFLEKRGASRRSTDT